MFTTEKFTKNPENRFWWWHMDTICSDPLYYYVLDDSQKTIMDSWYEHTQHTGFIGECAPPLISLLYGIISGSAITKMVQLGHCSGYSTLLLGFILKLGKGRLASVDISPDMTQYTQSWLDKATLNDTVKLIVGDSASQIAAEQCLKFCNGNPELLFIDSSHTYEHTLKELELWVPLVKSHGLICLHDASQFGATFDASKKGGVRRAIIEWCSYHNYPYFILNDQKVNSPNELAYKDGCGLGIIQKIS